MLKSNTLKVNTLENGLIYISFPNIDDQNVVTAFTTRMGGKSKGRYATMNMSFTNGDDTAAVMENYKILFSALGLDCNKAVLSHQTHTDNILVVDESYAGNGIVKNRDYSDIDGLITNCKNLPLVTQYADCVPLLFYDPVKKVVAASHGGWRGTALLIGKKTVEKMTSHFGSDPKDIKVGIAPSICSCCYEVDKPVYEAFKKTGVKNILTAFEENSDGKYMLSLQKANKIIIESAGVKAENIAVTDLCTNCNSHYFHSHRATNGSRGNLAAVIALI